MKKPLTLKGYTLSLLLHIAILVLLALIYFQPPITKSWHEFEWISELVAAPEEAISRVSDSPAPQGAKAVAEGAKPASGGQETAPSKPIPSPVIDVPNLTNTSKNKINIKPNSGLSAALNDVPKGAAGTTPGFSASLESGDAYFIRQTNPKITPLMDDEVVVEFRLAQSGSVVMNSVVVHSYRQAAHWEALRKEMSSWRFGFHGSYDAKRVYRLRCKFTLN